MTTLSFKVNVTKTEKRFSSRLVSAIGSIDATHVNQSSVSIALNGDDMEHSFSKLCIAYFPFPTLIQIVKGSDNIEVEVVGPLVLPFEGKIIVEHPGGGQTSPVNYDIVTS